MTFYYVEWIDEFGNKERKMFYSLKEADDFADELFNADYAVRQYTVKGE